MSLVIIEKLKKYLKSNALPQSVSKGKTIFAKGSVSVEKISNTDKGEGAFKVKSETGSKSYTVNIKNWNTPILSSNCSCDYNWGGICKHRVAALLQLEIEVSKFSLASISLNTPKKKTYPTALHIIRISSFDDWTLKNLVSLDDWKNRTNVKKVQIISALSGEAVVEVSYKSEIFNVKFTQLRFNSELSTHCSCSQDLENQACIHKLAALITIRDAFGANNPFDRMRDYTSEKNKLLAEFGFTLEDDLKGKFDFKLQSNGDVQLIKLDSSIQKISQFQNWRAVNNSIFRKPENTFSIGVSEGQKEQRQILYVIRCKGEEFINDVAVDTYSYKAGSNGKMTYIRSLKDSEVESLPKMEDSDNQIINLANSIKDDGLKNFGKKRDLRLPFFYDYLNRDEISANDAPIIEEYINKKLNKLFNLLSEKQVYTSVTSYVANQADIEEAQISTEQILPFFTLREDEDFVILEGFTKLHGKKVKLSSLNNPGSYWTRTFGKTIYKLANPEVANLLSYLPKNGLIKVRKSNFSGFFQDFILPLAEKFTIDLQVSQDIENQSLNFKEAKVYLKEDEANLMLIPVYEYTANSEELIENAEVIEFAHDYKTNKITYDADKITIQERNPDAEKYHYDIIRDQNLEFNSQEQYPFFFLPFNDVLKDGWLFKFFESMKEQNITIMGFKELKKFKYNPNKAAFNIKAGSGIDWFEMHIEVKFGEQTVGIKEIQKAVLKKQNYVELKDGTLGMLPEEWLKKYENILKFGRVQGEQLQISKLHFSLIDELSKDIDSFEIEQELFEKKSKLLNFKEMSEIPLPTNIQAKLRDYQVEGFKWLNFLDEFSWGGILADDMGLGKTLQMLTFLQEQQNRDKTAVNLVVLPTTLIFNWQAEAAKFCPDLKLYVHRGGSRQKINDHWKDYDIILTTYGMVRSDIELFREFHFNYIVLDESQAIKNPDSLISKAVRLLNSRNRLVMTGTPVENNTFDLYSQMEFINPGLLGSGEFFKTEFATPIDKLQDKDKAAQLRKIVYPFMLKRTKEEVAKDLPDKTESIIYCEMDTKQRKVYDTFRELYRQKLVDKMATDGKEKSSFLILEALLKLRQICDSPALLNGEIEYDQNSAKLQEIIREIEENAGNHKILIFSQFLKMLDLIKGHLEKHKIKYEYLDGKTTDRADRVNHFQEDDECRVFLMSLKAGGVGINLTEADYVYLVDPWWNPAVEQQAIDRTHRIGQKKNVFAYRMICKDTIEEKILLLQDKKRDIAKDIISTEDGFLKKLTQNDIIDLFS
ncbi:MAG: SNF2-related protein [Bacteroidota bacterium]|jgi:non-specific serine/threonine protein kinase